MATQYKKTAKDLAFDRERAKLTSEIRKLREEVSYWHNAADKANECANQFEELYLESLEYLNMTPEELQKMKKGAEAANRLVQLMDLSGGGY